MCSFLATNALVLQLGLINRLMKARGPDETCVVRVEGLTFLHNLLHMSGARRPQPLRASRAAGGRGGGDDGGGRGRVLLLFNGEVYNYRSLDAEALTDSEALLTAYLRWGPTFVRRLEGEFALCVADLEEGRFVLAVDAFGTKPLYYGRAGADAGVARGDGDLAGAAFGVASYRSALAAVVGAAAVRAVPPNSLMVFDRDFRLLEHRAVREFDVRQWKTSYEDWHRTLERAVLQRAGEGHRREAPPFLGLSAGFDSGALHGALLSLGLPHVAYTVGALEDLDLVRSRVRAATLGRRRRPCAAACRVLQLSQEASRREFRWVQDHVERHSYSGRPRGSNLADPATRGLSALCRDARARGGHRVLLSAAGGDELFSDYGNRGTPSGGGTEAGPGAGRFYGLYPEQLEDIFPWSNFFLGKQRDFLMKEELVVGAHGAEGRYVYLDARVAQEFLWLSAELKNRHYKAPLHSYMALRGYPFVAPLPAAVGEVPEFRRGFHASDGLLLSRASVVADFGSCGTLQASSRTARRARFRGCWSRLESRASRGRHSARRWRDDVLHGCAVGAVEPLAAAFRRCARSGGLNESEPDGNPKACAESYLVAERGGATCLQLAQRAGHGALLGSVLGRAEAVGLCSAGGCGRLAAARWGSGALPASADLAAPEPPALDGECAAPEPGLELDEGSPREAPEAVSLADEAQEDGHEPGACAAELAGHVDKWMKLSGLTQMTEDLSFGVTLATLCLAAGGHLFEVWLDIARYLERGSATSPFVRAVAGSTAGAFSQEQLLELQHFLACLPAKCVATPPRERMAAAWEHLVTTGFWRLSPKVAAALPAAAADEFYLVPMAPLKGSVMEEALAQKLRAEGWRSSALPRPRGASGAGSGRGRAQSVQCSLDLGDQGLQALREVVRLAVDEDVERPGTQRAWRLACAAAGGRALEARASLAEIMERHRGSGAVQQVMDFITGRGLSPGALEQFVLCVPASCLDGEPKTRTAAVWHLYLHLLIGLPVDFAGYLPKPEDGQVEVLQVLPPLADDA